MALLKIILNVDADKATTDPDEVAEAFGMDATQDIFGIELGGRLVEVNLVSAEWRD